MRRALVTLLPVLTLVAGALSTSLPSAGAIDATTAPSSAPELRDEVDNVVVVLQQNHTYDSYFGLYPRGRGYGEVERWPRNAGGEEIEPFLWTEASVAPYRPAAGTEPLSNGPAAAESAAAGGGMDGFVRAQEDRGFAGPLAMATHDRSTAPALWALADEYVLFDRFFSSAPGGSMRNLLHLFTGSDQGLETGTIASLQALARLDPLTLFDRLEERGVTWRFYSGQLPNIDPDAVIAGDLEAASVRSPAVPYWAPFLVLPRFWTDHRTSLTDQDTFFSDAATGTLPALSVVLPRPTDHPMNVEAGIDRLRSVMNAVMKSPQWDRTVVLVVWDDWGGFYDHVVPPPGRGFRLPLLVVSPWAKRGHIESGVHDHLSVLRFVLDHFDLPPLRGAAHERYEGSLLGSFDLTDGPRDPVLLPGTGLPAPPVGTSAQNALTLRLYLVMLAGVGLAAGPAAWWAAKTSPRPPRAAPASRT